jgi:hypothetical protein
MGVSEAEGDSRSDDAAVRGILAVMPLAGFLYQASPNHTEAVLVGG